MTKTMDMKTRRALFRKSLGHAIARARFEAHLSQREMGRRMTPPMSGQAIGDMEKGRPLIGIETLVQIAEITGASVFRLLSPPLDTLRATPVGWDSAADAPEVAEPDVYALPK